MCNGIYIGLQQINWQQKIMNDHLRSLNKRICNSTREVEVMICSLQPESKISLSLPKQKARHLIHEEKNPEQNLFPIFKRQPSGDELMENNSIPINTPPRFASEIIKYQYSKFPHLVQQINKSQNLRDTSRRATKGASQNKNTKFAVGSHLYPVSSSFLQPTQSQSPLINLLRPEDEHMKQIQFVQKIDHDYVLKHAKNKPPLSQKSKPEEIFDYFNEFASLFPKPLIKRFKNCLYFGQPPSDDKKNIKYCGFLYFFTDKIYYGFFQDQCKHGFGVEINLKSFVIYKGIFNNGHKIGKFQVFSDSMIYQGSLNKGKYNGFGKLQTPISIYQGQFMDGMRHGQGEEYFFKSGLKLKGIFSMNEFCNHLKSTNKQLEQGKNNSKKLAKNEGNKKLSLFQFSFHDSSDSEFEYKDKKVSVERRAPMGLRLKPNSYKIQIEDSGDDNLPAPFHKFAYNK